MKKLWCAIWTPTDKEGKLLKKELLSHLEFLSQRNVDGVLVCGSTGEFLHLDLSARKELLQFVVKNTSMEVLFNISHTNPRSVIELAHFAQSFPLTGVILLPPLYYPISPPDLAAYFIEMASHTTHPFYLYNFPEHAHVKIDLETLTTVHNQVPLAGIKMSGGDLAHLKSVIDWAHNKAFTIYAGNDLLLPQSLQLGAHGAMGGLINIVPEIFTQILAGQDLTTKLAQLGKLLPKLTFPLNIAAFMEARNLPIGHPKMPISESSAVQYKNLVAEFKALLRDWKL